MKFDSVKNLARIAAITTAIAASLSLAGVESADAQTIWRVNSVTPNAPENLETQQLLQIAERIEQKSNGQVALEIHYSSSLIPMDQAFDALSTGIIDGTWLAASHYAGQVPEADIYSMPYNFTSHGDFARKHLEGGLNAVLDEAFGEKGIKFLSAFPSSAMTLIMATDERISTMEQLQGKQLRVFGSSLGNVVTLLGGAPVYIPVSELEVALDRKVIDGFFTGWASMAGVAGQRRYAKSVMMPPMQGSLGTAFAVNRAKWDALTPELQGAVTEAVEEVVNEGEAWLEGKEAASRQALLDAGVVFTQLPPEEVARWREKVLPVWNDFVARAEKASPTAGDRAKKIAEIVSGS